MKQLSEIIPENTDPKADYTFIGYARVSTDDQKFEMQMDALKRAGCKEMHIFREKVSGAKSDRPQLRQCLQTLRKGDSLVVYKLDRLGRNLKELLRIVEWLEENGIGFQSVTENIDTTTPSGKFFFHIFGAVAQFERDIISERTRAGLAAARKRGRRGGRKPKLSESKAKQSMELLNHNPSLTHQDVATMLGVSRPTLYRAWQRHGLMTEIPEGATVPTEPPKNI